MNEKTIQYWKDISEYDIVTAEAMLKTGRLLYVGFMCHQAIEKILKAYYVKMIGETPPYIHDLEKLADLSGLSDILSEPQIEFLGELNPLNIESRYPKYKDEMFQIMKSKDCEDFLTKSKEFLEWTKSKFWKK
jgi:HEPN domain-containing protein